MLKKELSIKIDYLSIIFDTLKAGELIRKILGLPLEYFQIQKAKIKHKDYTSPYQFGAIKVYVDIKTKENTFETGCYLVLSGQGCADYGSFLQGLI